MSGVEKVRELVNDFHIKSTLTNKRSRWVRVCVCMDTIDDVALAVESFFREEGPRDTGLLYLRAYGLLQALYLQQDALNTLGKQLGMKAEVSDCVERTRELRNLSVGHPAVYKGGSAFLARFSLSDAGFQMLVWKQGDKYETEDVDLHACAREQQEWVAAECTRIADELQQRLDKHKGSFAGAGLVVSFSENIDYALENIDRALHDEPGAGVKWALDLIQKRLADATKEIERRGHKLDEIPSLDDAIRQASYATVRLPSMLSSRAQEANLDAQVFLDALRAHIKAVKENLSELDEYYADRADSGAG